MFKTIITKRKPFLFNFNQISKFKEENFVFLNSIKFFARKEVNKNYLIANLQRMMNEKNSVLSTFSISDNYMNQELIKKHDYSSVISKLSNLTDLNNLNQIEDIEFKNFYLEVFDTLKNENIDYKFIEKCIEMIDIKHSSKLQNSNLGFKFLILIHQIFNDFSLSTYRNKYNDRFVSIGFDHLMNLYEDNFHKINQNSEDLLFNNFVYFMIINQGEFSDILKHISSKSENFKNKLGLILSQNIRINDNYKKSKIDYNYFIDSESNLKTAPSEITNDYSFKYREYNSKISLYNSLVLEKQNIAKIQFLINSSNKLKNKYFGDFNEIQKIISLFLLGEAKNIFDEDLLKIIKEINKINKFIAEMVQSLTELKLLDYNNITLNNLENIFNPLFSAEKNYQKQYLKVADILGNENAENLFNIYLESQKTLNLYTLKDLFNMTLILNNQDNLTLKEIYFNVFIDNTMNSNVDGIMSLKKKHFNLSKNEKVIFDEIKNSLKNILKNPPNLEHKDLNKNLIDTNKNKNIKEKSKNTQSTNNYKEVKSDKKEKDEENKDKFKHTQSTNNIQDFKTDKKEKEKENKEKFKNTQSTINTQAIKSDKKEKENKEKSKNTQSTYNTQQIKSDKKENENKEKSKNTQKIHNLKTPEIIEDSISSINYPKDKIKIKDESNKIENKKEKFEKFNLLSDLPKDFVNDKNSNDKSRDKLKPVAKNDFVLDKKQEFENQINAEPNTTENLQFTIQNEASYKNQESENQINPEPNTNEKLQFTIQNEVSNKNQESENQINPEPNTNEKLQFTIQNEVSNKNVLETSNEQKNKLESKEEDNTKKIELTQEIHDSNGIFENTLVKENNENLKKDEIDIISISNQSENKNPTTDELELKITNQESKSDHVSIQAEKEIIKLNEKPYEDVKIEINTEEKDVQKIEKVDISDSTSSYKKDEFISMEEKFKKQKNKKFYYNNEKNFHTLIKYIKKNFCSANFKTQNSNHGENIKFEVSKQTEEDNNTLNKNDKKANIYSENSQKRRAYGDNNLGIKSKDEKGDLYKKDRAISESNEKVNYMNEINKKLHSNKKGKINKFSKTDSNFKIPMKFKTNFNIEKKIQDAEDDNNIINFLEKEDESINNLVDLSLNHDIIIEPNSEISDYSINDWIDFYLKNKDKKNINEIFELHLIQKLR